MQLAIIPALDSAFRPAFDNFLHPPPMLAMLYNILTNSLIFLQREVVLADVGPQIVQISLPDLFGGEFFIGYNLLGILELRNFHLSP